MKSQLSFKIFVAAKPEQVWEQTFGAESYKEWTKAFCDGSYFEGSWEEGASIRFLSPTGDGMVSEIAEARPHERLSIRHLGQITGGVVDTTSDQIRSWAPAYESYDFRAIPGGTEVEVTLDTVEEWKDYMQETFPKALARLKDLCEG